MKRIAIIGMGHLGTALLKGLIRSKKVSRSFIRVSNSSKQNAQTVENADIVFLTIKKSKVVEVLQNIKDNLKIDAVIISAIPGVRVSTIKKILTTNHHVVRIMPSIPISIGKGIIGIYFLNSEVSKYKICNLLSKLGKIIEVDEEYKLDILTVAAGCGPGVVAYIIQSLMISFINIGLTKSEALNIALQTMQGTCSLLKEQKILPHKLLADVATKGGITESIVMYFDKHDLNTLIAHGLVQGKQTLLKK
ncbi:hypothetical protein COY15_03955 [Candidatus Roizmanbacteria bacterium CG_4_10_14_0_2_um_filter_39_12]|nr:MAG: hypothetical protein COY15_03955 [Candidatus Roizmanbacteria bacterium CG_4_10_14_0_2_um_filter_39_12]